MPVATRSSSKNDTRDAVAGPSTKTSAKRPNPTSDMPTDVSSSLARPLKRTRVGTSTSKAPHKKRAGNQNENMMTLPIEIFTQVLSYVTPCSLVALIRTNKALRRILLNPSSKPIWQSATARVPGLPACPPWMSEPRYAALLFSTLCTLCGASTTLKPDPYLFARLCASCRDTSLVDYDEAVEKWHIEDRVMWSKSITPNSSHRFCLRRDVERVLQRRAEPSSSSSGFVPMFSWELKQMVSLLSWSYDSYYLAQYLSGLEQARNQELEAIKAQRRQLIHERLFGLGWTAEDVRVHEAYVKDWNALVEVARPLSDLACTTLIPRLNRYLEGSRKTKERETRQKRVKDLLIEYSRTAHPFNTILTKFLKFIWHPQPNPLPDMDTLLGWDLIRDLYEADISIDVVNEKFKERIPKLEPRLAAWRAKTEKRLIDNLKLERKPGPETQLEVHREIGATKDLPANTRFLLRADTMFKTPTEQGSSHSRSEFGGTSSMLLYYPYLLFSPEDSEVSGTIPLKPTDLSKFTRHTEAEKIAKALLADRRTPHITYLELQEMGAWFTCLRCHLREPKTWEEMIEHYREMNEKWENETRRRAKQTTKHKIVFANAHELRSSAGFERERLMLPNHLMNRDKEDSRMVECKLCLIGWPSTTYDCMPAIIQHLRNVHAVTGEPLENLHYGERTESFDMVRFKSKWCTRWDSYHSKPRGRR